MISLVAQRRASDRPAKNCERCERSFIPARLDQRFCSYACRVNKIGAEVIRACEICGHQYHPIRHTQRFCSTECSNRRAAHSAGVQTAYEMRSCVKCGWLYQPIMRNQKTRACLHCGGDFTVLAVAGRRMHYCTKKCRDAAFRRRSRNRFRRYELTPAEYDALVDAQGNRCRICGEPPKNSDRYGLVVDHDHATGVIRGLLCNGCNLGLGLFGDDPEKLKRAIAYLMA